MKEKVYAVYKWDGYFNDESQTIVGYVKDESVAKEYVSKMNVPSTDALSISNISEERIREEFNKIITSEKPSLVLNTMYWNGILSQIIPEFCETMGVPQNNPWHKYSISDHIFKVLDFIEPTLELRLSALFHDIGKVATKTTDENGVDHFYEHHKESAMLVKKIMRRLKYSNKEIEYVSDLVYWHMLRYDKINSKTARRFLNKVGVDKYQDLIRLMIADRMGAVTKYDDLEKVFRLKFECEKVIDEKQPFSLKDLAVNGDDLIRLGIPQGKRIGEILNWCFEHVMEHPDDNKYPLLIDKYIESCEKTE